MRHKRSADEAASGAAILAALGACRAALVRELPNMKPKGPMYQITGGVLAAIDALVTYITGHRTYFHDQGTTGRPVRWESEER